MSLLQFYAILDMSDGQIFMHVDSPGGEFRGQSYHQHVYVTYPWRTCEFTLNVLFHCSIMRKSTTETAL